MAEVLATQAKTWKAGGKSETQWKSSLAAYVHSVIGRMDWVRKRLPDSPVVEAALHLDTRWHCHVLVMPRGASARRR